MRFSVIIPIYNNKEWLPKCFDSLLNQTFTDYELLLVDDMSEEDIGGILEEYEKKFKAKCKGVKIFHNKTKRLNGGSRNVAIVEAQGEYVFAMDCDDWLVDDYVLEDIDKKLNGEDIMFLGYTVYSGQSSFDLVPDFKNLDEALKGCSCALWTRVVKTDILKQVLYKEGTLFEDQGHHYRLIEKCKTFSCFGGVTHIWNRTNLHNISKRKDYEWYRFNFCGEMYELIRNTKDIARREYYKDVLKKYMNSCNEMVERL